MSDFHHIPVLLDECLQGLSLKPGGVYLDGTLGGGGHSLEILKRLNTGRALPDDLAQLEKTALFVRDRAFCGLGKSAPLMVLSTLEDFREEYEALCRREVEA